MTQNGAINHDAFRNSKLTKGKAKKKKKRSKRNQNISGLAGNRLRTDGLKDRCRALGLFEFGTVDPDQGSLYGNAHLYHLGQNYKDAFSPPYLLFTNSKFNKLHEILKQL